MLWKVTTEKGTFELSKQEVVNLLIGELMKTEHPDHDGLAVAFTEHLQAGGALHNVQLTQLSAMAFTLGYYYRLMKEKYEIVLEEAGESSSDTAETAG
jgi:hypothetical protein